VVFVKNPDDRANVDGVIGFHGDGEVAGAAIELTHVYLLFSDSALMAGAAIWNKSPRSVVVDQTMKKTLIKRADTRLVACEAASSFCCDHLARVGRLAVG
jgi:hypothetical protein